MAQTPTTTGLLGSSTSSLWRPRQHALRFKINMKKKKRARWQRHTAVLYTYVHRVSAQPRVNYIFSLLPLAILIPARVYSRQYGCPGALRFLLPALPSCDPPPLLLSSLRTGESAVLYSTIDNCCRGFKASIDLAHTNIPSFCGVHNFQVLKSTSPSRYSIRAAATAVCPGN